LNVVFYNRSAIPAGFVMKMYSKDGIMLVGDAAGLTSSVSYGGIFAAVISGKLAGKVGLEKMAGERKVDTFRKYDRLLKKQDFYQKNQKKIMKGCIP